VADIFREVDEELRRENLEKLWKKYGKAILALAAVVVLAVAGYQAWKTYDLKRRQDLSDKYAAALAQAKDGDTADALKALAQMSDTSGGSYGGLAAFEQARLLAQTGDTAGAIGLWDKLANDSSLGEGFRDVATLLSVMHQVDKGDPAALRARLAPLAADGKPFRGTALELTAALALRTGHRAEAHKIYTKIADDLTLPLSIKQRATQMVAALKD
jgi:hypothetical protein